MDESQTNAAAVSLYHQKEFYIGLLLAVSSSIFIGSSFIIKKKGLLRLSKKGSLRASAGGFGYLKDYVWWAGLISMGLGEALNFTAYAFAPASLVTPLGALSVIVAAILSSHFLNERLNLLGKLGCFLCIIGSTIIVIHSPKEAEVENLALLKEKLTDTSFIVYVGVIMTLALFMAIYWAPKYGHKNVSIYIIICSAIGSLTVMSCKALGLAFRETISGESNDFATAFPWILIILTVVFIGIQMTYLNKALDIFNTSIVTPIYYVIFTSLVIVASGILFKEWTNMSPEDIIGDLCGFFVVICAVIMLNGFKHLDVSMDDVRGIMRPKRRMIEQNERAPHSSSNFEDVLVHQNTSSSKQYGTTDVRNI
ncbi:magnesium transporter NIPA2 [Culicoides brevitarsis]|uniref:magnesium transporter NIPA2 n=1 Tax=Culicoides brevitarsis TaxID=469753 RepID=UPI00307C5C9E